MCATARKEPAIAVEREVSEFAAVRLQESAAEKKKGVEAAPLP